MGKMVDFMVSVSLVFLFIVQTDYPTDFDTKSRLCNTTKTKNQPFCI